MIIGASQQKWLMAAEQIEFIFGIMASSKSVFYSLTLIFIRKLNFKVHLCSFHHTHTGEHPLIQTGNAAVQLDMDGATETKVSILFL